MGGDVKRYGLSVADVVGMIERLTGERTAVLRKHLTEAVTFGLRESFGPLEVVLSLGREQPDTVEAAGGGSGLCGTCDGTQEVCGHGTRPIVGGGGAYDPCSPGKCDEPEPCSDCPAEKAAGSGSPRYALNADDLRRALRDWAGFDRPDTDRYLAETFGPLEVVQGARVSQARAFVTRMEDLEKVGAALREKLSEATAGSGSGSGECFSELRPGELDGEDGGGMVHLSHRDGLDLEEAAAMVHARAPWSPSAGDRLAVALRSIQSRIGKVGPHVVMAQPVFERLKEGRLEGRRRAEELGRMVDALEKTLDSKTRRINEYSGKIDQLTAELDAARSSFTLDAEDEDWLATVVQALAGPMTGPKSASKDRRLELSNFVSNLLERWKARGAVPVADDVAPVPRDTTAAPMPADFQSEVDAYEVARQQCNHPSMWAEYGGLDSRCPSVFLVRRIIEMKRQLEETCTCDVPDPRDEKPRSECQHHEELRAERDEAVRSLRQLSVVPRADDGDACAERSPPDPEAGNVTYLCTSRPGHSGRHVAFADGEIATEWPAASKVGLLVEDMRADLRALLTGSGDERLADGLVVHLTAGERNTLRNAALLLDPHNHTVQTGDITTVAIQHVVNVLRQVADREGEQRRAPWVPETKAEIRSAKAWEDRQEQKADGNRFEMWDLRAEHGGKVQIGDVVRDSSGRRGVCRDVEHGTGYVHVEWTEAAVPGSSVDPMPEDPAPETCGSESPKLHANGWPFLGAYVCNLPKGHAGGHQAAAHLNPDAVVAGWPNVEWRDAQPPTFAQLPRLPDRLAGAGRVLALTAADVLNLKDAAAMLQNVAQSKAGELHRIPAATRARILMEALDDLLQRAPLATVAISFDDQAKIDTAAKALRARQAGNRRVTLNQRLSLALFLESLSESAGAALAGTDCADCKGSGFDAESEERANHDLNTDAEPCDECWGTGKVPSREWLQLMPPDDVPVAPYRQTPGAVEAWALAEAGQVGGGIRRVLANRIIELEKLVTSLESRAAGFEREANGLLVQRQIDRDLLCGRRAPVEGYPTDRGSCLRPLGHPSHHETRETGPDGARHSAFWDDETLAAVDVSPQAPPVGVVQDESVRLRPRFRPSICGAVYRSKTDIRKHGAECFKRAEHLGPHVSNWLDAFNEKRENSWARDGAAATGGIVPGPGQGGAPPSWLKPRGHTIQRMAPNPRCPNVMPVAVQARLVSPATAVSGVDLRCTMAPHGFDRACISTDFEDGPPHTRARVRIAWAPAETDGDFWGQEILERRWHRGTAPLEDGLGIGMPEDVRGVSHCQARDPGEWNAALAHARNSQVTRLCYMNPRGGTDTVAPADVAHALRNIPMAAVCGNLFGHAGAHKVDCTGLDGSRMRVNWDGLWQGSDFQVLTLTPPTRPRPDARKTKEPSVRKLLTEALQDHVADLASKSITDLVHLMRLALREARGDAVHAARERDQARNELEELTRLRDDWRQLQRDTRETLDDRTGELRKLAGLDPDPEPDASPAMGRYCGERQPRSDQIPGYKCTEMEGHIGLHKAIEDAPGCLATWANRPDDQQARHRKRVIERTERIRADQRCPPPVGITDNQVASIVLAAVVGGYKLDQIPTMMNDLRLAREQVQALQKSGSQTANILRQVREKLRTPDGVDLGTFATGIRSRADKHQPDNCNAVKGLAELRSWLEKLPKHFPDFDPAGVTLTVEQQMRSVGDLLFLMDRKRLRMVGDLEDLKTTVSSLMNGLRATDAAVVERMEGHTLAQIVDAVLDTARNERDTAVEQLAATSGALAELSRWPGDLGPVLAVMKGPGEKETAVRPKELKGLLQAIEKRVKECGPLGLSAMSALSRSEYDKQRRDELQQQIDQLTTMLPPKGSGLHAIITERTRQLTTLRLPVEADVAIYGTDPQASHLARAAACYALPSDIRPETEPPSWWPWRATAWKPSPDRRLRELAIAGALVAAEMDRLQAGDQK